MLIYSIYSLLATIGELSRKQAEIEKGIYEFSQIRTYPMPEFNSGSSGRSEGYNFDEIDSERYERNELMGEIEHLFKSWLKKQNNFVVSPHLLGKISTRFFYALMNIDANEKNDNLGDMFSLRIAALMNSILIEDAKESRGSLYRGINYNNVNTSYRVFYDNLNAVRENKAEKRDLSFSRWMLSCPLLLVYLDPETVERLIPFTDNEAYHIIRHLSVFEGLRSVSVRDRSATNSSSKNQIYNDIANRLQEADISFEYFDIDNKESSVSKNDYIRKNLESYFVTGTSSSELREFRRFLKSRSIKW